MFRAALSVAVIALQAVMRSATDSALARSNDLAAATIQFFAIKLIPRPITICMILCQATHRRKQSATNGAASSGEAEKYAVSVVAALRTDAACVIALCVAAMGVLI